MYSIFGGDIEALRVWLLDERFMDGWEPKNREALGHTIAVGLFLLYLSFSPGDSDMAYSKR